MKKQFFCQLLLALSILTLNAQTDTVFNQIDSKGLKQGIWKKQYPNGHLMYQGEFKDDQPIGEMRRYYESDGIQAIIKFDTNGTAKAKLFYEDGDLSAEGNFYQMQKDSLWQYYSYYTNTKVSEEFYLKGKKNGIHKSFYENGQASEEIEWVNDYKEGKWMQYFEDGTVKLKATHNFNMVNGRYYYYYPNGLLMILGNFVDDKRHGPWVFYDENGKEKYTIEYSFGNSENAEALIKSDQEYFDMIEENIGKFEDPALEDFFPGGGSGGY
jgi:antitoxin component YwqK of YwqJK toxin-antitoxin module